MTLILWFLISAVLYAPSLPQTVRPSSENADTARELEVQRGSKTAKGGFQNEDEIRDKFNQWKTDTDAQAWLKAMKYELPEILNVVATKPHGEKADVEVRVQTKTAERIEGISIKLVSNPGGFNQIDKRWLATYAEKWTIPADVHEALKKFVGEVPPTTPGRNTERMFLDEFDEATQTAILEFFTSHKDKIVSDLFAGDGPHAAGWIMVTLKQVAHEPDAPDQKRKRAADSETANLASVNETNGTRWIIRSTSDAIRFYGEGEIKITSAGSLRIGRITMQRKGGDNGRESANMLQFKINPAKLFEI